MKITEEWYLAISRENEYYHEQNLKMQSLLNEQQTRILQYQRENIGLRKQNDNLQKTILGDQNVYKGGIGFSKEICIRGVSYVLKDEYEKLDSILRDKERRLEQIKAVANGNDNDY